MYELGPDLRNHYLELSLGGGSWAMKKTLSWAGVRLACAWDPPKQTTNQMPAQAHCILGFYGTLSVAKQLCVSNFLAERSGQ